MPLEALRFIHAAGVLMDHQLRDIGSVKGDVRKALLETGTQSFERIIEACLDHEVDFLLLTGDTFDERDRSLKARVTLREGFETLNEAGIQVFIVPGVADPATAWQSVSGLPENTTVFNAETDEPTAVLRHGNVIATIQGCLPPSDDQVRRESGSQRDSAARTSPFRIGIVPPTSEGSPSPDLVTKSLAVHRVDYLALGRPFASLWESQADRIAHSPGPAVSPSRRETGPLGCSLIEVLDRDQVRHERLVTSPVRREQLTIEVRESTSWDELHSTMRTALESLDNLQQVSILLFDWHLIGSGSLHASLSDDAARQELFELLESDSGLPNSVCVSHRLIHEHRRSGRTATATTAADDTVWQDGAGAFAESSSAEPNLFAAGFQRRLDSEHSLVDSVMRRLKAEGTPTSNPWFRRIEALASRVSHSDVTDRARRMAGQWFAEESFDAQLKRSKHDD